MAEQEDTGVKSRKDWRKDTSMNNVIASVQEKRKDKMFSGKNREFAIQTLGKDFSTSPGFSVQDQVAQCPAGSLVMSLSHACCGYNPFKNQC